MRPPGFILVTQQPLLGFGFHLFKVVWPLWSPSQTEWPSALHARPIQTHARRHERAALFNEAEEQPQKTASVAALKLNFVRFPACSWPALCGSEITGRTVCPGNNLWDQGSDPWFWLLYQRSECAGIRRQSGGTQRIQHMWETRLNITPYWSLQLNTRM